MALDYEEQALAVARESNDRSGEEIILHNIVQFTRVWGNIPLPLNPLFSVIYLADDEQQDGRLEVNEIYSLDLTQATDLVVLSACETQAGAVSAGDEVMV